MLRRNRANRFDEPNDEPLDDELLALRAVLEPAAFAPLYRKYLPLIRAFCYGRLGNAAEAEDAAAEVFRKVWTKLDTFHGNSFRKWIYTIALNTLRDLADRPPPPMELFPELSDPAPGPEELALLAATDDEVRAALACLPDDWRTVVELRAQGYRGDEVGEIVGRDAKWVREVHFRAVERLARELGVARQRRARHG